MPYLNECPFQLNKTELQICPINQAVLETALNLPFTDYEDAVQHASAVASGMHAIISRNLKDYSGATLPVYAPVDFLTQIARPS